MTKDLAPLIARLAFGATMFFAHGLGKLMRFSQMKDSFPDPLGIGNSLSLGLTISAEVGCALLIALGLFTRLASIPAAITMFVAVVIIHGNDPWSKMEMGFIYFWGFVLCALLGSGRFSLDYIFRKKT